MRWLVVREHDQLRGGHTRAFGCECIFNHGLGGDRGSLER
jgi:hypothetical protein